MLFFTDPAWSLLLGFGVTSGLMVLPPTLAASIYLG